MSRFSHILELLQESTFTTQIFKVRIFHDSKWHEYETTVNDVQNSAEATYDKALQNVLWSKNNKIENPKELYIQLKDNPKNYSVNFKRDISREELK